MISVKHLKGIHVAHHKNTAGSAIIPMPVPEKVYIPMIQHIGAPNQPTVSVGDHVKVGQVIGDNQAPVCAPVHSSVSGDVVAIEKFMTQMGRVDTNIVIQTDGKQETAETVVPPTVTNKQEFLKAVRDSGLVGLGGAAFPTHIKYNPRNPEDVDTLIINGAECEPYITVDHMTMLAHAKEIVEGTANALKFLSIKKGIIAIEGNKPDAIALFKDLTQDIPEIEVFELRLVYPQGAERVIIFETTGRHLIAGKLPADVGVIVSNVNSILKLQQYLDTGMPLVSKSLTVDGNLIARPQNVEVPIGTKIKEVIDFCGGTTGEPKKILFGGPMMGRAMPSDDLAILKGNNAILVFDEAFSTMNPETACINCGRCVRGCPMNLMPTVLAKAWDRKDLETLKEYDALSCMECGCCSYSCPARIQLSYKIKLAKGMVMDDLKAQAEKAKAQAEGGKN
ncbi:MAG: electron transport complex subunit RsxC [Eubacteriales bacterium]|jgi:electron transport complex protein RnfC|nr:electron transport complex subunit RsxC [Eubacteriales bacterium]MDD3290519.1 electron transport complex subunit RsxC [Eubacteriales bacterium]MDD3863672.1 electron transport complex subunit RsxC [Eubacteriales bacterium]MDD4444242.1 electron transport complex subunit RsxC [Eubacteriales bacterium]